MADVNSLEKMFEMHIKECDGRDERNTKAIDEIKDMFKGIWDAHDSMRSAITKLQIRAAFALGGLMVVGKIIDYFFQLAK